jgi:class 3 adenylate cyclase
MRCPSCGQENPPIARFCLACATPLTEAPPQAEERRIVTVVFVDLVGFTARAERLDPEDVRAILRPFHERVRRELERFDGLVEKFAGDAVMAVFGAHVAHGDDPERAVRAALAVRDAISELNERSDLGLQARIGINTGEAIVTVGARPERGEAMVAGDVVNTAQRLQSAAPTDGIIVGDETHRATSSTIGYDPLPPIDAKGKAEPLSAWLALAPRGEAGERPLSPVPMVGRERELSTLLRMWELVTIFGPAGIGKSRLAHEFERLVVESGARVLRGRSLAYGGSGPYGAFAQLVKQIARIFDNDHLADAHEKLQTAVSDLVGTPEDDVTAHLALLIGLRSEESVSDWETLFFSARLFVEGLAARQPTVLVLEDIHWADRSLLDLVELLAARVRDVPLLVLTLARPELLESRPTWGGGLAAYTSLTLPRLSEEAASELAGLVLSQHVIAEGTERTAALAATAEGNPLFIEELVRSLAEGAAAAADDLPTSIRGIVGARLDALPPEERRVLLDAAVVGRIFWRGVLERLDPAAERLADVLGSLEQRDLIRREAVARIRGEQQFVFKHALIRDVAYQTLSRAERRRRHAAVAEFLEESTPELGVADDALALHWREAGENGRALVHVLSAAEQAGRGWAKERAVALYREALELAPEEDAEQRGQIRRRLAVALMAYMHADDVERQRPG